MVRVDEIEVMHDLRRQQAAVRVHDLDVEAVDPSARRHPKHGDRRLGDLVMRGVGGQVHGRELDDHRAPARIGDHVRAGRIGGRGRPARGAEREDEAERPYEVGVHSGEL